MWSHHWSFPRKSHLIASWSFPRKNHSIAPWLFPRTMLNYCLSRLNASNAMIRLIKIWSIHISPKLCVNSAYVPTFFLMSITIALIEEMNVTFFIHNSMTFNFLLSYLSYRIGFTGTERLRKNEFWTPFCWKGTTDRQMESRERERKKKKEIPYDEKTFHTLSEFFKIFISIRKITSFLNFYSNFAQNYVHMA